MVPITAAEAGVAFAVDPALEPACVCMLLGWAGNGGTVGK